jgi:hypothetical protein
VVDGPDAFLYVSRSKKERMNVRNKTRGVTSTRSTLILPLQEMGDSDEIGVVVTGARCGFDIRARSRLRTKVRDACQVASALLRADAVQMSRATPSMHACVCPGASINIAIFRASTAYHYHIADVFDTPNRVVTIMGKMFVARDQLTAPGHETRDGLTGVPRYVKVNTRIKSAYPTM